MKDKVLIRIFVPELQNVYELYIPVNEVVWKIKKLIIKSLIDITEGLFPQVNDVSLINKKSGKIYFNNEIIFDTDIRNATDLMIILTEKNKM